MRLEQEKGLRAPRIDLVFQLLCRKALEISFQTHSILRSFEKRGNFIILKPLFAKRGFVEPNGRFLFVFLYESKLVRTERLHLQTRAIQGRLVEQYKGIFEARAFSPNGKNAIVTSATAFPYNTSQLRTQFQSRNALSTGLVLVWYVLGV
ncbi:uncharacterized protein K452DRAFT_311962 [Aplosporella prunicola CBS 121167]|uniref:Uncharacterized protein n=1 Tax=Aplosporella prunicola CBS 121167 TaxID=1176127 RepID=A0A6A6B3P6_9PEZI|nr:uncharacterized protein K452DRAFT_311962 [Aplosporella prunicola CBS 121167]KAF2137824.1 hypothetical protein K452DRAFT_311962 [Aplosporella prunicola CBS 121167]